MVATTTLSGTIGRTRLHGLALAWAALAACGEISVDPIVAPREAGVTIGGAAGAGADGSAGEGGSVECAEPRCEPACDESGCRCPPNTARCGVTCSNLLIDAENCGECGNVCLDGARCGGGACLCAAGAYCGGACVSLLVDPAHCGACGSGCAEGQECAGGECR